MKLFLSMVMALTLAGPVAAFAQNQGTPFGLGVGESIKLAAANLTLGFSEVAHDSRCPRMVMCVWEGDAEIALWAESPGFAIEEFSLNTHPDGVQQVQVFGYSVTIVRLDPYPFFPGDIDPSLYEVTLVVENAGTVPAGIDSWSTLKSKYRE